MGGSLNISFNNGCLSIRYHLFIKMVFKFGTEGRYSVTNGNILLFSFLFSKPTFFRGM